MAVTIDIHTNGRESSAQVSGFFYEVKEAPDRFWEYEALNPAWTPADLPRQDWTAAMIGNELGRTEKTVRNYRVDLEWIFYDRLDSLKSPKGRYTSWALLQMLLYQRHCGDGSPVYKDGRKQYKKGKAKLQAGKPQMTTEQYAELIWNQLEMSSNPEPRLSAQVRVEAEVSPGVIDPEIIEELEVEIGDEVDEVEVESTALALPTVSAIAEIQANENVREIVSDIDTTLGGLTRFGEEIGVAIGRNLGVGRGIALGIQQDINEAVEQISEVTEVKPKSVKRQTKSAKKSRSS